jgi:hypothetical protein
MIPDKRATHRVSFERPITADMMAIDGTWRRACTLKDVSDSGAKLLVEGSVQGLPLKEFFLVLSSLGLAYLAASFRLGEWRAVGSHVHRDKPKRRRARAAVPAGP